MFFERSSAHAPRQLSVRSRASNSSLAGPRARFDDLGARGRARARVSSVGFGLLVVWLGGCAESAIREDDMFDASTLAPSADIAPVAKPGSPSTGTELDAAPPRVTIVSGDAGSGAVLTPVATVSADASSAPDARVSTDVATDAASAVSNAAPSGLAPRADDAAAANPTPATTPSVQEPVKPAEPALPDVSTPPTSPTVVETPADPEPPSAPETPVAPEPPPVPETPAVPEPPTVPETPAVPQTPAEPAPPDRSPRCTDLICALSCYPLSGVPCCLRDGGCGCTWLPAIYCR